MYQYYRKKERKKERKKNDTSADKSLNLSRDTNIRNEFPFAVRHLSKYERSGSHKILRGRPFTLHVTHYVHASTNVSLGKFLRHLLCT